MVTSCSQEVSIPVEGETLSAHSTFPSRLMVVMHRMTSLDSIHVMVIY